jgi:hypothetical protein
MNADERRELAALLARPAIQARPYILAAVMIAVMADFYKRQEEMKEELDFIMEQNRKIEALIKDSGVPVNRLRYDR